MANGIIYVATGSRYYEEAQRSAESAKAVMPSVPIKLFTDQASGSGVFDQVERIAANGKVEYDKATLMLRSPFERTLYSIPTPLSLNRFMTSFSSSTGSMSRRHMPPFGARIRGRRQANG